MAKKTAVAKAKAKDKDKDKDKDKSKQIQVKVQFRLTEDTGTYYINHAEVSNTPHEFVILCGRVPAKLTPTQRELARESGELVIDPLLQLTIPPTLINGLIRALTIQKDLYEQNFGKIRSQNKAAGDENVH